MTRRRQILSILLSFLALRRSARRMTVAASPEANRGHAEWC